MANCESIGARIVPIVCLAALSAAGGCGSGVNSYMVDPVAGSAAAIKQYDKDGDGLLNETELKSCPALLGELRAYDKSGDRKLSQDEIAEQIKTMYKGNSGLTSIDCTVTLDGGPLSGATVRFIPEAFLGSEIKAAEGVTNSTGNASIGMPAEELPKELRRHSFLRAGIYRVEITHPARKIPAKYNTETILGFEFHRGNESKPPIFNLVSK